MSLPKSGELLVRWMVPADRLDDVLGDLEEAHRRRVAAHGGVRAAMRTNLEALDVAFALLRHRPREVHGVRRRVFTDGRRGSGGLSLLDVKLGVRMLVKNPALTVVAGLGMAVTIAIAAGYTSVLAAFLDPELPLPEGDRIVVLQNWDTRTNSDDPRSLHDFVTWREGLTMVEYVGAYRTVGRNLSAPDGSVQSVAVAEMSSSGFRVAGVQPLLGRYLAEQDEREDATPALVLGHDAWQTHFAADPQILGREVRLGTPVYTVVGVMPPGFAFPVNHQFWVPFRADPTRYERGEGPSLTVFGRLAAGVTLQEARAELDVIGRRTSAAFPDTHERLRAQVQPYAVPFSDMDEPDNVLALRLIQFLVSLLLIVVCANVAALVYARTAARRGEILVRTALGASRRRVVAQLFTEALVLAAVAAVVGLGLAGLALQQVNAFAARVIGGGLPFWMDFSLTPGSVLHALSLAVLAAVITGVVPAVQATGTGFRTGLQQVSAGASAMLLGRTWTVLIVGQVAFAVALLPTAVFIASHMLHVSAADPGYAAGEYLTALVAMERGPDEQADGPADGASAAAGFDARYDARITELMRRLREERDVAAVTYSWVVPGAEPVTYVEIEGLTTPAEPSAAVRVGTNGHRVRLGRVDVSYFDAFDVPVLSGRGFSAADTISGANGVIVNRSFVREFFGAAHVIGRRVRHVGVSGDADDAEIALGKWYEIVGVVPDFGTSPEPEPGQRLPVLYEPVTPAQLYPVRLAVRTRGDGPAQYGMRLHQLSAAVDPALQLRQTRTLEEIFRRDQSTWRVTGIGIALVTASVLLLSAAGIYAMMSFTVARRRREIGIRAALGAHPHRIMTNIFARSAAQLGTGIVVGIGAALLLDRVLLGEALFGRGEILLPAVAAIMMAVGLVASLGPARRGLRIAPTEALKQE